MKKLLLIGFLPLMFLQPASAQWSFYLQGGYSPAKNPTSTHVFVNRDNPKEEFLFNVVEMKSQYAAGMQARLDLNEYFFTEIGLLFSQQQYTYLVTHTFKASDIAAEEMKDKINQLIIPASIGAKLGKVEVLSGLSLIRCFMKENELEHIPGYANNASCLQMGWHAGANFRIDRVLVGVAYEARMARVCEGMTVNDGSLALQHVPGRVVFKAGYRL